MWFNILLKAWCCATCDLPVDPWWPKPCTCGKGITYTIKDGAK